MLEHNTKIWFCRPPPGEEFLGIFYPDYSSDHPRISAKWGGWIETGGREWVARRKGGSFCWTEASFSWETDWRGGNTKEKERAAAGELEVGLLPRLFHVLLVSSSFWVYLASFWVYLALLISLDWIICYISWIFWIIFFLLIVDIVEYHSTLAMATFVTHPTSPLPILWIPCMHPTPNTPHESATTFSLSLSVSISLCFYLSIFLSFRRPNLDPIVTDLSGFAMEVVPSRSSSMSLPRQLPSRQSPVDVSGELEWRDHGEAAGWDPWRCR